MRVLKRRVVRVCAVEQLVGLPYRCTRPAGHPGPHVATVDGELVAAWGSTS